MAIAADQPSGQIVQVQMRNIMYRVTDDASVHIARLDGNLQPTREGTVPSFDDAASFLDAQELAVTGLTGDVRE